jgi:hypothetical protein
MGIRAVPNQGICDDCREDMLRPDVYVERDCKYLQAVPEPTPNEEGTRGMGFGERRGE